MSAATSALRIEQIKLEHRLENYRKAYDNCPKLTNTIIFFIETTEKDIMDIRKALIILEFKKQDNDG